VPDRPNQVVEKQSALSGLQKLLGRVTTKLIIRRVEPIVGMKDDISDLPQKEVFRGEVSRRAGLGHPWIMPEPLTP